MRSCLSSLVCKRSFSRIAPASSNLYFQDLQEIKSYSSSQLSKIAVSAADRSINSVELWAAITQRTIDFAPKLKVWDAISVMGAIVRMGYKDREMFVTLGEVLPRHISSMTVNHICDILTYYERVGVHPRAMYVEMFHGLMKKTDSMYGEEFALVLTTLAQLKLGNPEILKHYCRAVVRSIDRLDYVDVCRITGALRALGVNHSTTFEIMDLKQQSELACLPIQELIDVLKKLKDSRITGFFWEPYESHAINELQRRLSEVPKDARYIAELNNPFDTLQWLKAQQLLNKPFLLALAVWSNKTVHERATNSSKRPLAHDLILLHSIMTEDFGMTSEDDLHHLTCAIKKFALSRGGNNILMHKQEKFIPLVYQKGRQYRSTLDPLENDAEAVDVWPASAVSRHPPSLTSLAAASPWKTSVIGQAKTSLSHRNLASSRYKPKYKRIRAYHIRKMRDIGKDKAVIFNGYENMHVRLFEKARNVVVPPELVEKNVRDKLRIGDYN